MRQPRILIYVQNLLGIGHFKRVAVIAEAAAQRGLHVTLVSGGECNPSIKPSNVRVIQLPSARIKNGDFSTLLSNENKPLDKRWQQYRRNTLLDVFDNTCPDLLIIELFPFGRRQMDFELLPLLKIAHKLRKRPIVVCSVRDILVGQYKPGRAQAVCRELKTYFDHILVHSDPEFVKLDMTFPETDKIKHLIKYTGYVTDAVNGSDIDKRDGEVIVSVGGGAVGHKLLRVALDCRSICMLKDLKWRFLLGPQGNRHWELLDAHAMNKDITIERNRSDFPAMLHNCALSLSQGGYNTIVEILKARAPAVIVPFSQGGETEQGLRARLLEERGLVKTLDENLLSPYTLAAKVDSAFSNSLPELSIDLNGAKKTADFLLEWVA